MIEREAQRLLIKVPMVMANARDLLEVGRSALQPGEQIFDLKGVATADSSAIAVMLGWLRVADRTRSTVKFAHIPPGVRSLAELYGVTELLPLV
jgi:phospholipid transport system transporter-binding protein